MLSLVVAQGNPSLSLSSSLAQHHTGGGLDDAWTLFFLCGYDTPYKQGGNCPVVMGGDWPLTWLFIIIVPDLSGEFREGGGKLPPPLSFGENGKNRLIWKV